VGRMLLEPVKKVKFDQIPGVSGEIPTPRKRTQLEVTKDAVFLYGGVNGQGDTFDELYKLELPSLVFTRLHVGEMMNKLTTAARQSTFVGGKLVSISTGEKGALDVVQEIDILGEKGLADKTDYFALAMIADLKVRVAEVEKQVKVVAEGMDIMPEPGDFEALRHAMACIFDVKTKADAIEFELDTLQDVGGYLANMGEAGPVTLANQKIAQLQESWAGAKKKTPALKKAIKPLIDAQGTRISDEIKAFEKEVTEAVKTFESEPVFMYDTGPDDSYVRIDEMHIDLCALEKQTLELFELATLFEFPDQIKKTDTMVKKMRDDLILIKKLWDVVRVTTTTLAEWQKTLWNDINTGAMEEESKTMAKTIKAGLNKRVRDFDAYNGVDTLLKNFMVTLPAVSDLRSPSMRPRHWELLMSITGQTFDMGPTFALSDLIALELHRFVDDVGEVVDRAQKEDKMEQTLAKLEVTWATVEFVFTQHRDSPVHLISMKEEDFETLEDNQLVVQGMMASKYLATFETEVTGWQKKLGNISDVLAQMSEVQRKWAYLETLFIGSEEVKKELPESTKRFEGIDKSFKVTLGAIHEAKNAVHATSGPTSEGQMKMLEVLATDLELCEKDLAAFLESKRRIFPRFYFLATNYLLDILSNGNRPWVVMGHINNLLQASSR